MAHGGARERSRPAHEIRRVPAARDGRLMVKRAGGALLLALRIDPASPRPLSAQLYVELRDLILSGGFAPQDRLPATRTLAAQLRLSRTTVIEAYDRLTA